MFLEDDMVVSPYYYNYLNQAFDVLENVDSTVGLVNSSTFCFHPLSVKIERQNYFFSERAHLTNYIISRRTWEVIQETMNEYTEQFLTLASSYKERDHVMIEKWIHEKVMKASIPLTTKTFVLKHTVTSQDSITSLALTINGLRYLSTCVNRVLNIGVYGEHWMREMFVENNADKVVLDIMEQDAGELPQIYEVIYNKDVQPVTWKALPIQMGKL
jgi:hypothetical protein